MLTSEQLSLAIDIHQRAYKLLNWLVDAIDEGFIQLDAAHRFGSASDAARAWIVRHYENLPFESRPEPAHLEAFANYFSSYLETSFDLVRDPGQRWSTGSCGCDCEYCMRISNLRHLRPKAVQSADRKRAAKLRFRRTEFLAREQGLLVSDDAIREIADESYRPEAAYSAYGASLLDRLHGIADGPAILVLWREIAWNGSQPKKSFRLHVGDFLLAEKKLIAALSELAASNQTT